MVVFPSHCIIVPFDLGLPEMWVLYHQGFEHVIALHVCGPLLKFVAFLLENNRWLGLYKGLCRTYQMKGLIFGIY